MITKAQKVEEVQKLSDSLARSKASFLVNFQGMNVEQMTDLRKKLNKVHSEIKVVRNSLGKRALTSQPGMEQAWSDFFTGTNAFVFSYDEDVGALAKVIDKASSEWEVFQVKSGFMRGALLSSEQVKVLATLPGKQELRAMFLGVLKEPMSLFVRTLNEVPSSFVRVLNAHKKRQEEK